MHAAMRACICLQPLAVVTEQRCYAATGKPCCPSNANTAHSPGLEPYDRKPFCRDGSTCCYDSLEPTTSVTSDAVAGVTGV
jgi:hypothetical protein